MQFGILDYSTEAALEQETIGSHNTIKCFNAPSEAHLPNSIKELDGVLVWHNISVSKETIDRLTNCKLIVRIGVGFDSVDIKYAGECGIPVLNIPDYGTNDVADHTLALMLCANRSINTYNNALTENPTLNWHPEIGGNISRLTDKTLGIIGLGRIGTAVALRAKAFGLNVLFYDPYIPDGYDKALLIKRVSRLEEIFKHSHFVSIHTPLTEETNQMINESLLELGNDIMLINTARGSIVENLAVFNALKKGNLRAFAADVLEEEPPSQNDPLIAAYTANEKWLLGRVILTPHAAFYAEESRIEMRQKAALQLKFMSEGAPVSNCVNKQYLKGDIRYGIIR